MVSQQQAIKRWDTLPDNLRQAIFSDYNAELLWRVCENQHLAEDKIQIVATLAGNVLMGFIHPEDFSTEIREAVNINSEIAKTIAAEIDKKIFNPLKSDLKNIYQPIGMEAEEPAAEVLGGGSGVLDLREKPSFEIVENKIDLSKFAAPSAAPVEFRPEAKVEKVKEEAKKIEPEKEKPAEEIKINTEPILFEKQPKEEKIEEKPQTKEDPQLVSFEPVVLPQAGIGMEAPEEAPLMIHKEEEIKPLAGKWKSLGGMFGFLQKRQPQIKEETAVKAQFEIGGEEKPAPIEIKPQIKVVDYSEPASIPAPKQAEEAAVKMPESLPENLPIVKEDVIETKPEIKMEEIKIESALETKPEPKIEEVKIEEHKPQIEPKNNSEEIIDLGMFK